jgi:hypothetical protein
MISTASYHVEEPCNVLRSLIPNSLAATDPKTTQPADGKKETACEDSNLLQTPNIEDHSALYWAIVNHWQEVFSAFAGLISKFRLDVRTSMLE